MFPFASFQYCFLNYLLYPFIKRLGTEDYGKSIGHGIRQPWVWIPKWHKPLVQPQPGGVSFLTAALRTVPCMGLRKTGSCIVELCSPAHRPPSRVALVMSVFSCQPAFLMPQSSPRGHPFVVCWRHSLSASGDLCWKHFPALWHAGNRLPLLCPEDVFCL